MFVPQVNCFWLSFSIWKVVFSSITHRCEPGWHLSLTSLFCFLHGYTIKWCVTFVSVCLREKLLFHKSFCHQTFSCDCHASLIWKVVKLFGFFFPASYDSLGMCTTCSKPDLRVGIRVKRSKWLNKAVCYCIIHLELRYWSCCLWCQYPKSRWYNLMIQKSKYSSSLRRKKCVSTYQVTCQLKKE